MSKSECPVCIGRYSDYIVIFEGMTFTYGIKVQCSFSTFKG